MKASALISRLLLSLVALPICVYAGYLLAVLLVFRGSFHVTRLPESVPGSVSVVLFFAIIAAPYPLLLWGIWRRTGKAGAAK
jgi:hypothetical protein